MAKQNSLTASLEDYLEVIYHIIEEKQAARVKEIAKRLEVNNSSVTGALRSLSKKEFLNYTPYDVITLTDKGKKAALDVIRRHEVLKKFIIDILCIEDIDKADDAACKMEHAVTPEVLERIVRLVEFAETCPRSGKEWINGFRRFCQSNFSLETCKMEADKCISDIKEMSKQCAMLTQKETSLNAIPKKAKARLISVDTDNGIGKQLSDRGITPGSLFLVESINSETGDINVSVRGYHLTIRQEEAKKITVIPY
ncbi:MAG: metal-dependent transcriptional regulator [Desulfobacteraceae bacterium]|nr:metal-dependent transcriptional regulator [Desulfobacteraceae bacterium]